MNLLGEQAKLRFASSGIPTAPEGSEVLPASAYYLGVTINRVTGQPMLAAATSRMAHAALKANDVLREYINPYIGLRDYQARSLASGLNLPRELWQEFTHIAQSLYSCHWGLDALVAEIDPLILTREGAWLAVDGRLVIDDNALYRQPELADLASDKGEAYDLMQAAGITYVKLEGQIGCVVNGAGLAMATLDLIHTYGGAQVRAANFFDIGGGAQAETVTTALRILLSDRSVRCILINIFGGLTRCDEVAWGILRALDERHTTVPMVIRLVGTHAGEGRAILHNARVPQLISATTLTEAARLAVGAVKEG
jgi:succinyl-CoA synthetase beta subunit